jgi:hypothetical protein
MQEKERNQLRWRVYELTLKHPESGILQELAYMNETERQAALEMLERLPED